MDKTSLVVLPSDGTITLFTSAFFIAITAKAKRAGGNNNINKDYI